MRREKAQAAQTARPKVPMRRLGADCSVVVMKRGNARGAKGAGHRHWLGSTGNGRNLMFNGRRQPSCDGTSRMTRESQVRICERLGVLYIFASAFAQGHWKRLAQLALDYRLPTMYGFHE